MKKQRGFNLIELMTVVALTGVLLGVGLPAMRTFSFDNRITTQINAFSSSLSLARSEAVKSNQNVVVCPSINGSTCASAGTDWNKGYLTFIDRANSATANQVDDDGGGNASDDPCGPDAGDDTKDDCILSYIQELSPSTTTLKSTASFANFISYDALGRSNTSGLFVICDHRGDESAKALVVSTTGRVSVTTKFTNGNPLKCASPFN